jgi:hypothetical protein
MSEIAEGHGVGGEGGHMSLKQFFFDAVQQLWKANTDD